MVTDFNGFNKGVIGKKMPSDSTLNNMKKADLIKLLHIAQHNYETLNWFYNNAVKVNMSRLNNNGWIPCSEKLPEKDVWVLGQGLHNMMLVCYTKSYRGDFDWMDINGDWRVISAWYPLPESYKGGE